MSTPSPGRRRFLGTALAVGAGAAAWPLLRRSFGVEWDGTTPAPLAEPTLTIHRGHLEPGTSVRLRLMLEGPGFREPLVLRDESVVLEDGPTTRVLPLEYTHPRLVPGRFAYRVDVAPPSGPAVVSDELAYTLHRFTFGV